MCGSYSVFWAEIRIYKQNIKSAIEKIKDFNLLDANFDYFLDLRTLSMSREMSFTEEITGNKTIFTITMTNDHLTGKPRVEKNLP